MQQRFIRIAIWLAIIALGIQTGAATYETFVITPVWAGNPPASVREWNSVPALAIRPERYWIPGAAFVTISSIAILVASFFRSPAKRWCLFAGLAGLAVIISTAAFFVPILRVTIFDNGVTLSDAEVVSKVGLWTSWTWLRYAVMIAGWLAAIRALRALAAAVPAPARETSQLEVSESIA